MFLRKYLLAAYFAIPFSMASLAPVIAADVAESPSGPQVAQPAPSDAREPASTEFEWGPIRSRDPEVRAAIQELYREQHRLGVAARSRIQEILALIASESDPDARLRMHKEIVAEKEEFQIETLKLGLEIARLNGDEQRVRDYELAIDQFLHPEKYMPAPTDRARPTARSHPTGQPE